MADNVVGRISQVPEESPGGSVGSDSTHGLLIQTGFLFWVAFNFALRWTELNLNGCWWV